MESFRCHTGLAVPLVLPDIDTDQIIPVREMVDVITDNYGAGLFANWRYVHGRARHPGFILNQEPWAKATILVTGRNFGCGSSRELAPRALRDYGFRSVVAPSFAPIFFKNCFRNGILPVALTESAIDEIAQQALAGNGTYRLAVDLDKQRITTPSGKVWPFSTPDALRRMLLDGADEIDLTLSHQAAIDRFIATDSVKRPWVYSSLRVCTIG